MSIIRPLIAIIGDAGAKDGSGQCVLAENIGRGVVVAGFRVVTGGLGGVMEAASRGARTAPNYREGDTIGILPGRDAGEASEFVDIAIPTGMDHGRNMIVALSSAVIAVGGGAGSLSEICHAWMEKRLIIALRTRGWSGKLADQRLDDRIRYTNIPDDRIYGAANAEEAVDLLRQLLPLYVGQHRGIAWRT